MSIRAINLEQVLPQAVPQEPKTQGTGFGEALARSMQGVEQVAQNADQATEAMVSGQTDIHEAMIAMEKADLVIKMGTTVRNKLLDAYRQLSQVS